MSIIWIKQKKERKVSPFFSKNSLFVSVFLFTEAALEEACEGPAAASFISYLFVVFLFLGTVCFAH